MVLMRGSVWCREAHTVRYDMRMEAFDKLFFAFNDAVPHIFLYLMILGVIHFSELTSSNEYSCLHHPKCE